MPLLFCFPEFCSKIFPVYVRLMKNNSNEQALEFGRKSFDTLMLVFMKEKEALTQGSDRVLLFGLFVPLY